MFQTQSDDPDRSVGDPGHTSEAGFHGWTGPPDGGTARSPALRILRDASESVSGPVGQAEGRTLIDRLMERRLAQWTMAYLAVAWLLLQLTDVLSEIWEWPIVFQKGVSLTLGLGLFPATVLAWYHGEQGRQDVCCLELALVGGLVAAIAYAVWRVGIGGV